MEAIEFQGARSRSRRPLRWQVYATGTASNPVHHRAASAIIALDKRATIGQSQQTRSNTATELELVFAASGNMLVEHFAPYPQSGIGDVPSGGSTSLTEQRSLDASMLRHERPFEIVQARRSNDEKHVELIRFIRDETRLAYRATLADRIQALVDGARDEGEPEFVSAESLRQLLRFLQLHPIGAPSIVVTPAGNFRAEWRRGRTWRLALEFFDDGTVRYVMNRPDPERPALMTQHAGAGTADGVLRLMELGNS